MAAVNPVPPQAPANNSGQPWALYFLFAIGLLLAAEQPGRKDYQVLHSRNGTDQ